MSRFLKERHYRLVLPAIKTQVKFEMTLTGNAILNEVISRYMETTGVSFTQQDVTEIEVRYHRRYGQ